MFYEYTINMPTPTLPTPFKTLSLYIDLAVLDLNM